MSSINEKASHLLNQMVTWKHDAIQKMIQVVLEQNPNAYLFGSAVRDKILEMCKTQTIDGEFDESKAIVPNIGKDLDFFVTSESDFEQLKKFFQSYYHEDVKECEDTRQFNAEFVLFTTNIPLIIGHYTTIEWMICVTLVHRKVFQRIDFDVNSLIYNGKTIFIEGCNDPIENLLKMSTIVEHIKNKTAYILDNEEENDISRKLILQERALSLMERGWNVCMKSKQVRNHMEYKYKYLKTTHNCHKCGKRRAEIISAHDIFCSYCWFAYERATFYFFYF